MVLKLFNKIVTVILFRLSSWLSAGLGGGVWVSVRLSK